MNLFSKKTLVILLGASVVLAGCSKPKRPTPDQTVMGPAGSNSLNPSDVNVGGEQAPGTGLQQRLPDGATEIGNQIRGLLQPVFFDFDRSAIKQSERAKIQAAAQYLQGNPTQRLLLEGHCDWRGTEEYNLGLGDRRANAVKQFLLNLGVTPDKIDTLSKGSLEAVKNGTPEQMAHDRRVEIVVLKQ